MKLRYKNDTESNVTFRVHGDVIYIDSGSGVRKAKSLDDVLYGHFFERDDGLFNLHLWFDDSNLRGYTEKGLSRAERIVTERVLFPDHKYVRLPSFGWREKDCSSYYRAEKIIKDDPRYKSTIITRSGEIGPDSIGFFNDAEKQAFFKELEFWSLNFGPESDISESDIPESGTKDAQV